MTTNTSPDHGTIVLDLTAIRTADFFTAERLFQLCLDAAWFRGKIDAAREYGKMLEELQ